MSRWLLIAHAFNMDGRAASQTVTDKIPYLLAAGIEPVVLSGVHGARSSAHEHHRLLPFGPAGLRFDVRHVLRQHIGQGWAYRLSMAVLSLLLAPGILLEKILWGRQSHWSWALPAFLWGYALIRWRGLQVIYSSGGAYSAHLAGLWLKRATGLPWIVEVHDPLVRPGQAPSGRDEKFQARLEAHMAQEADLVWWFTQGALRSAQKRHPAFSHHGHAIVPGANPPSLRTPYVRGSKMVLAHFGSLSSSRSLAPFFDALAACFEQSPALKDTAEIHIYGTRLDAASQRAVKQHGLQAWVHEHGRLEYSKTLALSGREQVMQAMQRADGLLLAHGESPDCAEYIPSKFYEYLWGQRPILALTHLNPQLNDLLIERGGFVAASDQKTEIQRAILAFHADWSSGQLEQRWRAQAISVSTMVQELLHILATRKLPS